MLKMAHGDLDLAETARGEAVLDLDKLCQLAARDMIAVALEAERRAYLEAHAEVVGDDGRRLVVGHGSARPRQPRDLVLEVCDVLLVRRDPVDGCQIFAHERLHKFNANRSTARQN